MTRAQPEDGTPPSGSEPSAGDSAQSGGAQGSDAARSGSTPPRRRHRRVVRRGTETITVAGTSADERPEGWSEQSTTNHDAELLRDRPPHWGGAGYRD